MVIYLAGLQGVPQQLYDAAEIDGANSWQRVRDYHSDDDALNFPDLDSGHYRQLSSLYGGVGGNRRWPWLCHNLCAAASLFQRLPLFPHGLCLGDRRRFFTIIMAFTILQFWLASRWVYYEAEQK